MTAIQKRCAACGSECIIPLATIRDRVHTGLGGSSLASETEPVVAININPHAGILAQRHVLSRIHAWVCGECGYMPLFADNPQELYTAYQAFLRATQGENRAL